MSGVMCVWRRRSCDCRRRETASFFSPLRSARTRSGSRVARASSDILEENEDEEREASGMEVLFPGTRGQFVELCKNLEAVNEGDAAWLKSSTGHSTED